MLDYFNLGYSQLVSAIALIGGFCGAATFFFLNQFARDGIDRFTRLLNFLAFLFFIISFVMILSLLMNNGNVFIEYSKTLPKENIIFINLSCENELNCSANIPSHLTISCQEPTCPIQKPCPNITIVEKIIQPEKPCVCPPMVSVPKF